MYDRKSKALIVVLARLKSTRLPFKALKPLGSDHTIVTFLLERLTSYQYCVPVSTVLATSNLFSDQPLVDHVLAQGYNCHQGHPLDVIQRILTLTHHYPELKHIIRVTGDNPFTCPVHIDRLLHLAQESDCDYSVIPSLNTGLRAELISLRLLSKLPSLLMYPQNSEYLTYMVNRPDKVPVTYAEPLEYILNNSLSFTVDTNPEYLSVCKIVDQGFKANSSLTTLSRLSCHMMPQLISPLPSFELDIDKITQYGCQWKED